MAEPRVFDVLGERHGEIDLPKAVFDEQPNMAVMHQAYLRQLANARQGTASTKTRGDVSGGGAKPYRQKGTGRARHGSIREPSMKWRRHRVRAASAQLPAAHAEADAPARPALGAQPEGARRAGARDRDASCFDEPKTKQAADLLDAIGFDSTTLVVLPAPNLVVQPVVRATSPGPRSSWPSNLNIRDLFTHTYLLISKDASSSWKRTSASAGARHGADGDEAE